MSNYSDFEERPIYRVIDYCYYFFATSIYFSLCNFLLIISTYIFNREFINLPIYVIVLIPMGPAVVALFSFMYKVNYDKNLDNTRCFFKAYVNNFKASLKLWTILLFTSAILIFDLKVCIENSKFPILVAPIILMLVLVLMIGLYSLPILARYEVGLRHNIKLSMYFILKKPLTAIVNLIILGVWVYLILFYNGLIGLFVSSISAYLITKNLKGVYLYIDENCFK